MKKIPSRGAMGETDHDEKSRQATVLLLRVATGQVQAALADAHDTVARLHETFASLVDRLDKLDSTLTSQDTAAPQPTREALLADSRQIGEQVHQAIVDFQFYDRLAQRLEHVASGLDNLGGLLIDPALQGDAEAWEILRLKLRDSYAMEEERALFDAVLAGMPLSEALDHAAHSQQRHVEESGGGIQLF